MRGTKRDKSGRRWVGEGPPRAGRVREDDRLFRRVEEVWAEVDGFLTRFAPWNTLIAIIRAAHFVYGTSCQ